MATINSREIVDEIIRWHGHYDDDPQVIRIVQYNNQFNGALAYGLIYEHEDPLKYHKSLACINPVTIWDHNPSLDPQHMDYDPTTREPTDDEIYNRSQYDPDTRDEHDPTL